MRIQRIYVAAFALFSTTTVLADFQYQQTTRMTGGFVASMARFGGKQATEPVTSTVAVKGNRMVHLSKNSGEIIDLDKETTTHIDFDKQTYSVMTFAEMKQRMQEAMQRMQGQQAGNQPANPAADKAELSFKASVKDTGRSKDVNGVSAREYILTMAMGATDKESGQSGAINMTNDMWMAPEIAGYQEVKNFQMRMAGKLGSMIGPGANPMAMMRPEMTKGMAEMAKEMAKLKGIPVLTIMRMGSTADGKPLPAASEAPELSSQSQVQMPNAGDVAGRAATGAATSAALGRLGGLGGLGGFGKKKPKDQPQEQPSAGASNNGAAGGGGLLMESTTEMSGYSSTVDSSKFVVPAGFKQVASELERHRK
jgi:hypothetical protein